MQNAMADFVDDEGEFRERHVILLGQALFFWDDPRLQSPDVDVLQALEQEMATCIRNMEVLKENIVNFLHRHTNDWGVEDNSQVLILLKITELDGSLISHLKSMRDTLQNKIRDTPPRTPPYRPEGPLEAPAAPAEAPPPAAAEANVPRPQEHYNTLLRELERLPRDQPVTVDQLTRAVTDSRDLVAGAITHCVRQNNALGQLTLRGFDAMQARIRRTDVQQRGIIANLRRNVVIGQRAVLERPAEPVPFLRRPIRDENDEPMLDVGELPRPEQAVDPIAPPRDGIVNAAGEFIRRHLNLPPRNFNRPVPLFRVHPPTGPFRRTYAVSPHGRISRSRNNARSELNRDALRRERGLNQPLPLAQVPRLDTPRPPL